MAIASRAAAADDKLGQHDRQACQDDKAQVNEDKRGTAVLADQVRETPEISKATADPAMATRTPEELAKESRLAG